MKMISVESSVIRRLGYEWHTQTLRLEFHSGAIYDYANVPPKVVVELQTASSIGQCFNTQIKDAYEFASVQ